MSRLAALWEDLRSSLWFLPSLIVAACAALAVGLVELDGWVGDEALARFPRLFGAGAEGTRSMLSAIGGAMINIAGVTFSVTIVALSLTSSQYSPRVLRNFMRDRSNQTVLGAFLGIYAYCLIVVRTVRAGADPFVPSIAAFGAIVLAFAGVGLLIHFIHHISASMQAAQILRSIHRETSAAIMRLYPNPFGEGEDVDPHAMTLPELEWTPVAATESGYLTAIDGDALLRVAREHDCVIRLLPRIGDFVIEAHALAYVSAPARTEAVDGVANALTTGPQRNMAQDAAFGIRQIVDIAEKALSPAINDTTTAAMCVDRLAAILSILAGRSIPASHRLDGERLRVIAPALDFAAYLDGAIDDILPTMHGHASLRERLVHGLRTVAAHAPSARRNTLLAKVRQVERAATTE